MTAPPRIVDDPSAASSLRADLQQCALHDNAYNVNAGLARFQAAITQSPIATDPSNSMTRRWFGIGLAVVVGVTAAWFGTNTPTSSEAPAPATVKAASAKPELARDTPSQPAVSPTSDTPTITQPQPQVETISKAPAVAPRKPSLQRELDLIAKARQSVDDNPKVAYRLTRIIAREFPEGVLREEREALTAIALWNLGERQQARTLAQRFLAQYPLSPMRQRLQNMNDDARN